MNFNIFSEIKKAARTTALFIKRIPNINFKSEREVIGIYEINREIVMLQIEHRHRRFNYYAGVFDLNFDDALFDALSEKQTEQMALIWKLVDMEGVRYA